jgi:hypothetical protein
MPEVRWLQFIFTGNIFPVRDGQISGVVRCDAERGASDADYEMFLDALDEAIGGTCFALEGGGNKTVAPGVIAFHGDIGASLHDEPDGVIVEIGFGSAEFCEALAAQYGLPPAWVSHAVHAGTDLDYGAEASYVLPSGLELRWPLSPQPLDHVRVVIPGEVVLEAAYWTAQEWREDPEDALRVVLGLLAGDAEQAAKTPPSNQASPLWTEASAALDHQLPDDGGEFDRGYRHALQAFGLALHAAGVADATLCAALATALDAFENNVA